MPKHSDKFLLKFNLDNKEPAEVHVDKFILAVQTMNVPHEDIVCHLFPLTFEGKASTWYFLIVQGSITNWVEFNKAFLDKFGEDKTPALLSLELSRIKMEPKERIKYFNQRFITLKNKILVASQPPSPSESPPHSLRSSNQGSSLDSEGSPMAGNIPIGGGGGGNPPNPPNPQLPWLRTTAVTVPGVEHLCRNIQTNFFQSLI